MRIIIPMAGMGKRMRPQTLTLPKPLFPVAGKPIVQRLVEDLAEQFDDTLDEIAYIIGDFGSEVEQMLHQIASRVGAKKSSIYYQEEPLGTAHAILCAGDSLEGEVIVAFADTLFEANFSLDKTADGVIWVKQIDDPSSFGVVKLDENGYIVDFIEKPVTFVSDLAIIGIYFFRDASILKNELQYLIDNDIKEKGEYQLTNALENMKNKGMKFLPGKVLQWMDCGNKQVTIETNAKVLELKKDKESLIDQNAVITNSKIIGPCYIGPGVELIDSEIGPYVSLGKSVKVTNSKVYNSIIRDNTEVTDTHLQNSILGENVKINSAGRLCEVNLGDYSEWKTLKNGH